VALALRLQGAGRNTPTPCTGPHRSTSSTHRHSSPLEYVRRQADLEDGQITVTKGGTLSKGTLEITGISAKQPEVQMTIVEFSDKEIVFG
jgi:hypothetical protein